MSNAEELDSLISDPDEMRMQALLIRERILGPQHPDTSYYIRYRGAVYADSGNFERCINLWKYALDMQQSNLDPLSPMTASSLLSFAELFSFMLQDRAKGLLGTTVSFEDLMGILSKSVLEIERAVRQKGPLQPDPAQLSKALSIILHLVCLLEKVPCTAEQDHFKKETIYRCVYGEEWCGWVLGMRQSRTLTLSININSLIYLKCHLKAVWRRLLCFGNS